MTPTARARLGGLGVVATRGADHMADLGRLGQGGLDRRLAAEAGIPEGAPDYQARLDAARKAHFVRLAEARWARPKVRARHGTREEETRAGR